MKHHDWNELQKLWTSLPEHADPVGRELERIRKFRPWWIVSSVVEILIAAAGIAFGGWLLARGDALGLAVGAVTILYTVAVSWLSLRARRVARVRLDDPVTQAVADAVRNARLSVRLAAAMIFAMSCAMAFTAMIAITVGLLAPPPPPPPAAAGAGYVVIGAANLILAAWLLFAFLYYRRRSADLARLEAVAASLGSP
jgi:hypothetical protein